MLSQGILIAGFLWALCYGFEKWRIGQSGILAVCTVYLCACLAYEAFYFEFIPLILIGMCLYGCGRVSLRPLLRTSLGLIAVQLIAMGWYFASGHLTAAQKPIKGGWFRNLGVVIEMTLPSMFGSLVQVRWLFLPGAACLVAVSGLVLVKALRLRAERAEGMLVLCLGGVCLSSAALSMLPFVLGGRAVYAFGVDNRTLSFYTLWLLLGTGVVAFFVLERVCGILRRIFLTGAVIVGGCFVVAHALRVEEWAEAWRQQQKILAEAPVGEMAKVPPGAKALYVYPIDVRGAPIFCAPWDINTAMPLRHPALRGLNFIVYSHLGGPMIWNRRELAYKGAAPLATAPILYVWKPGEHSFYRADVPFKVNADLSVTTLAP